MLPMKNWKKWQKILLIGVVIAGLLVCGAAGVWGVGGSSPAEETVEPFLQSSGTVIVGQGVADGRIHLLSRGQGRSPGVRPSAVPDRRGRLPGGGRADALRPGGDRPQ